MMKHTNTGAHDSEEEFDDIQVIENPATPPLEDEVDNKAEPDTPPYDAIEVHEDHGLPPKPKESNGIKQGNNFDHETYYLSKPSPPAEKVDVSMMTSTAQATKYSRPLFPRVLVALLVILVLAVIALAFVLYHLDQNISANKDKTLKMSYDMQDAGEMIKKLQRSIGNETFIQLEQELKAFANKLGTKTNETRLTLLALKVKYNHDVQELRETDNNSTAKMMEIERVFQADIKRLSNESKELNKTLRQLDMFIEFNDHYKGKIGLTFQQVVELTHEPHRVDKDIPHLMLLEYQFKKFSEKNKTWGIKYAEVIRLTDSVDFELGKPIPLLQKIDSMYNIFTDKFEKIWKIEFEDVLRLTTKDDVSEMTVKEWQTLQASNGTTMLLDKINYMFNMFNKTYRHKWKTSFEAVISLTEKIDFKIGDQIPILLTIDKLYFQGFEDYWGTGFAGFARVVITNRVDGTDIVKKLQAIKRKGKVFKFVPGIFERSSQGKWSVYGVAAVYNRKNITQPLRAMLGSQYYPGDKVADILCRSAGYIDGVYDKGKYNLGTGRNLEKYYNIIQCPGKELTIDECVISTIGPEWEDKDDAGVKCTI